jgi:hypothetical protein
VDATCKDPPARFGYTDAKVPAGPVDLCQQDPQISAAQKRRLADREDLERSSASEQQRQHQRQFAKAGSFAELVFLFLLFVLLGSLV